MPIYELKLQMESTEEPSDRQVLAVLEKHTDSPKIKILTLTKTIRCALCGQDAEVMTHYESKQKRWWQFWLAPDRLPKYHFSSSHGCLQQATQKYASPDSPWYSGTK